MNALSIALSPALLDALEQMVEEKVRLALRERMESTARSPYMSVAEAADYLRCSRQRVYDLLSSGRLQRYKDGSRVLLRRDDVETYLGDRDLTMLRNGPIVLDVNGPGGAGTPRGRA